MNNIFFIKKTKSHGVFTLRLFFSSFTRPFKYEFYKRRAQLLLLILLCALSLPISAAKLPTLPLQIGLYRVQAEVAADNESRSRGLMFRTEMENNQGMLFVFDRLGVQCFWMKNTLLPLTAAFLNDQGKIVNMRDMSPQTETPHCSNEPVRYVLEMNQGWFAKRGIKEGTVIKGIP